MAAGTVTFDNGVTGAGFTSVAPDDYGTYGFAVGQQYDDEFYPPGVANPFSPTHLTGPELFITTAGNHTSSVLLTDYKVWADFVENPPPTPDGILADPMHTAFARTVTTAIAMTGTNQATSAFRLATDTQGGIRIDVGLVQSLTSDSVAVSSQLDSVYTFTNNGTLPVSLVIHFMWDSDLFYNGANKDDDDVVGVGPGLCGIYQHDGDPRWSIGLGNGPLSTVPLTYYYAGKDGFVPGSGPAFVPDNASIDQQYIWLGHGMPPEWQNYVVGPGKNAVGESGSVIGDATVGIEYHFPLAVGASETINVRRYWGTTTIPCFVSANCGNGVVDSGELCDGADTPTCNGATCTASTCGDGYMNTLAGEQCDSSGVDSETCNGATCLTSACGDGYVNAAAGEDCETGELCDTSTCTFNFSVGGGCAGCGVGGMPDASWLLCGGLLVLRRRRRPTRR